ncbi:trafficking protein particle complex subunit 10-like [Haliotis rufescens]|uniref:trafficking protein particle complex subunit 10-like n=1 Tax=Haliotis rufescens TaxID=6454 RepID=UPI00201F7AA9|nr:trafficking protein particle complex subunit 10-like [Haliotis rufescens]
MEAKPIVTCHGDQSLFSLLHPIVLSGLPKESCEWKRSYGRAPRTLQLEASFVPYDADILPEEDDRVLISRPYFHIYWTDCDLEGYKQTVKEDIAEWQAALKGKNIPDWLIVVVVMDESKVKSKILPRSSVIDKVKNDFCNKAQERCLVLTEPMKTDPKSAESWYNFFIKLRPLLLTAYNRQLGRFEDNMRALREKRNEPGWNYMEYFVVQEELAFMFEILGVYDDALLQYDELDALFTQFAENHAAGAHVKWLTPLIQPCSNWSGLSLTKALNHQLRDAIKMNKASVLEFRNYLFSRQCALLFLLKRPGEVAQRALDYLHYTVQEMIALEVEVPQGALWCWVFLSSLAVLETCERYNESSRVNKNSLCIASLWDYARRKLKELGNVCGLIPGTMPTSKQLSCRVDLTSGMVTLNSEDTAPTDNITPLDRLRQALSSDESYKKHYLEMCELAMGTYKHICRFRSARIIGRDLADFYMLLGEPHKAEGFLLDAIKMYRQEHWGHLADGTMLELAVCQAKMDDNAKFLKTACHIACSPHLKMADREHYFSEVMRIAEDKDEMCILKASKILGLEGAAVMTPTVILNEDFVIDTKIHNHFPRAITCSKISISVSHCPPEKQPNSSHFSKKKIAHTRTPSLTIHKPEHIANFQPIRKQLPAMIDTVATYEKRQGKIVGAGLTCKNAHELLKRTDSGPGGASDVDHTMKGDFTVSLLAEDIELQPGENNVQLKMKTAEKGVFYLSQLCYEVKHLDFLKSLSGWDLFFKVVCDQPRVELKPAKSDHFIAGIKQEATLTLLTGSFALPQGCSAQFKTTENLEVSTREGNSVLKLSPLEADQSSDFTTTALHQTRQTFDGSSDAKLTCHVDVWDKKLDVHLNFVHPFKVEHVLHTCKEKKYLQVTIKGNTKTEFLVSQPELSALNSNDVELQLMNRTGQQMKVNSSQTASILWQIRCNIPDIPRLETELSFLYTCPLDLQATPRKYLYTCSVENFQTKYILSYNVTSPEEDKQCKTGKTAALKLQVKKCNGGHNDPDERLVYDVRSDTDTWALVGKSTGIFFLKDDYYETILDVVAVKAGFVHLPLVHIHKYRADQSNMEESSNESLADPPEFVRFSRGEVYNSSVAQQVHVYPEMGGKDVEVSLMEG